MNKAVFLDKDGTLIVDVPYNVNPAFIHLYEYVAQGLHILQEHGFKLILVSNQSGIGKGLFKTDALQQVFETIQALLNIYEVSLDAFYYCPHEETVGCDCRKPLPGMLLRAADDWEIDLSKSWMIGDILNDIEAGNQAGCKSILINNGNETEWALTEKRQPFATVKNMEEAARIILS